MNDGISVSEACEFTPQGLTAQQLQNCPGQESTTQSYEYAVVVGFLIVIALTVFLVAKSKHSKKSS